ncbi:hypothetical protein [Enterococcus sp. C74]|uniref:hypothetical protein n=1 Tax=Enterococcus sp. C74 TaxID=3231332 RepID=UPI002E9A4EB6|nr:hypothetical protein [Enterococcus hirae]EMF0391403.1 hypothetical protein [Enterococcus hirae]
MKKSYFTRTFHIIGFLLMISILLLAVQVPIKMIGAFLQAETNSSLVEYTKFLFKCMAIISKGLDELNAFTFLLFLLFVLPEIVSRIARDSLVNWVKSFWVSYRLRRFLVRQTDHEGEGKLKIQQHNKAIRNSIIDVRNDSVTFIVKLPNDVQAQKLILDTKEILREEISSRFPNYVFSNFERYKHWLKLEGTNFR